MDLITPPHNIELEKQLINLMVLYPETLPVIISLVASGDFYHLLNRGNFETIKKSYSRDGTVDLTEIKKIYEYTCQDYISPQFAKSLAKKLREISRKRSLFALASSIHEKVKDTNSLKLMQKISKSLSLINSTSTKQVAFSDLVEDTKLKIEKNKAKDILGLTTGFYELDKIISGLQATHVWVLGGYTNYGKTTVAIAILCNLLKNHKDNYLLFCSLEMSKEQIIHKIISNFTRKTFGDYRQNFNQEIKDHFENLKAAKLEITDDLFDIESIEMKIRGMEIQNKKPFVVFIDFIQNIQGGDNEYEKITNAMVRLQSLAKKLELCFVILSQVNNESAKTKSEVIGFKSTGAIAAVADITIQVVRNKLKELDAGLEHVDMKLVIQKNRHGQGAVIDLEFDTSKGLIINH